jgi:hypothetical protein
MKTQDVRAVGAVNASDRRALAVLAYDNATADPASADWRAVAELLRAALPAARKVAKESAVPSWWQDYAPNGKCVFSSVEVTFADGRTIRASAATNPGKPLNLGRALRTAIAFYRAKMHRLVGAPAMCGHGGDTLHAFDAHVAVPDIAMVVHLDTGAVFDPEVCSRLTADTRAGWWGMTEATEEAALWATFPVEQRREAFPELVFSFEALDILRVLYVRAWHEAFGAAEAARRSPAAPADDVAEVLEAEAEPLHHAYPDGDTDAAGDGVEVAAEADRGETEPPPVEVIPAPPRFRVLPYLLAGASRRAVVSLH